MAKKKDKWRQPKGSKRLAAVTFKELKHLIADGCRFTVSNVDDLNNLMTPYPGKWGYIGIDAEPFLLITAQRGSFTGKMYIYDREIIDDIIDLLTPYLT